MIGVIDCDIQIYAQIDNLIPINKYMYNIIKMDEYYRYRIHHLFPDLPIPKGMKAYDFYQHIKGGKDIFALINYVFTLDDQLIYQWLFKHYPKQYGCSVDAKIFTLTSKWHKYNDIIHDVNELCHIYLTHQDIICHNNSVPHIKLNIKFWIKMVTHNDIIQKCIDKYDIKI